ncbi:S8 family serine peptidase [Snodgrassella alvi]|nr:autotransporter domain-containing protein [Snodgrassella alvi]
MPSDDPSKFDSSELAEKVSLSKNQYGGDNQQANRLNLKDARDQGLDGSGVKVGIVDLPVHIQHPALPENTVDLGEFGTHHSPQNTHTHGDIVALVTAGKDVNGRVLGIASNANLHVAGASYIIPGLIDGNAALKALHALNEKGVKIVNNSYGSNYADYQQDYIDYANEYLNSNNTADKKRSYIGQVTSLVQDNMLFIWAAGNSGENQPNIDPLLPLIEPELQKGWIAVAGVNWDNNINEHSNRCGDAKEWCMAAYWQVDMANLEAQPGDDINSLPLSAAAGTSIAAPQVTGAAVLVKQKYPWMTNDNLRTTLLTTATDLGAKGVDSVYGWGLLNIGKAVNGPAQFAFGNFSANVTDGQYIFSNDISGKGGLIKNGSGTLILQGQHTYQGETWINSGMLALDGSNQSEAHIVHNGTYQVKGSTGTVNNAGTFISRDATINGNFTQTADATFQTNLGNKTTINGTANLAGRLYFDALQSGFVPETGTKVEVINAQQRNGEFDKTELSANILLDGKTVYDGHNVNFDITRIPARTAVFANHLLTHSAADQAIQSAADAVDKTFTHLDSLQMSELQDTQKQDLVEGAVSIQNVQSAQSLKRSLYSLSGAVYSNANVVNTLAMGKLNNDFMSSVQNTSDRVEAIVKFSHSKNRWNPSGIKGKQNTNSGILGASKNFGNGLSGAIAYTFQNSSWNEPDASADIKSNGLMIGSFYAPDAWKGAFLSGSLGYNRFSNDVNHQIWLGEKVEQSGAKVKGNLWQLAVNGGKPFNLNRLTLTPQLGMRYDYLQQNSFTEDGAHGFGLHARKLDKGIIAGTANLLTQYRFDINDTLYSIFGSVGVEHDFQDRDYATRGGFAGMHSNEKAGRWSSAKTRWNAAVGSNIQIGRNINAGIQYQYENGSHWHSNSAKANLNIRF